MSEGTMGAAPSWVSSSLTWLQTFHPHLGRGRGTASQRLARALDQSAYLVLEQGSRIAALAEVGERLKSWGEADHKAMLDFFKSGGYAGAKERAEAEMTAAAVKAPPKSSIPAAIIEGPDGPEAIVLEGAEDGNEEDLERSLADLTPMAEHVHSVDEAVADALRGEDERYGAW